MNETIPHSILLSEYAAMVAKTDRLPEDAIESVLMGIFGEVGSVMATAKKLRREERVYVGFQMAAEEEFGDVLWYLTALCRRLGFELDEIFSEATSGDEYRKIVAASDLALGPISYISAPKALSPIDLMLLQLGEATVRLLPLRKADQQSRHLIRDFASCYLRTVEAAEMTFATIVRGNIKKARGRFLEPDYPSLPTFDSTFILEERLPDRFKIEITERKSGHSYLRMNNVFIGDPLTDNIRDPDGYRFHDVFHLAYAAILHWSPVFRALLKQKRKSDKKVDEAQDGGRAIVVEEGLTAWIFSQAKQQNFFADQNRLSFDLLKTIEQFVQGYEVAECPLRLWEIAILEGYKVFRQVRENNGGIVMGDRVSRTIDYKFIDGRLL